MCIPCLFPWLAALLAKLGLEAPTLPYGAVRYWLGALACYRLVMLIGLDDGPFGMFLWLRIKAGRYDLGTNGQPRRALGRLLACPYCLGIWAASMVILLALWPSLVGDVILFAFALAGAQALLQEWQHGPREGW